MRCEKWTSGTAPHMVRVSGRCVMREALSLKYICTALFTALCLTLSTVPSAHAGKGKPNVVRVSKQHMKAGFASKHHRISRGHFKRQSFRKHRRGKSFAVRRDRNRHRRNRRYYYGYDRGYRYRDYPQPAPSYQPRRAPQRRLIRIGPSRQNGCTSAASMTPYYPLRPKRLMLKAGLTETVLA